MPDIDLVNLPWLLNMLMHATPRPILKFACGSGGIGGATL